jgi:hypothetical protein
MLVVVRVVVLKASFSINWYAAATGGVLVRKQFYNSSVLSATTPIGWTQRVIVVLQVLECKLSPQ